MKEVVPQNNNWKVLADAWRRNYYEVLSDLQAYKDSNKAYFNMYLELKNNLYDLECLLKKDKNIPPSIRIKVRSIGNKLERKMTKGWK